MAKKRLFQILDEMNAQDAEQGTHMVTLHPDVTNIQQTPKGIKVTVGVPHGSLDVLNGDTGKHRVVLMIIDGDEYDKRVKG